VEAFGVRRLLIADIVIADIASYCFAVVSQS